MTNARPTIQNAGARIRTSLRGWSGASRTLAKAKTLKLLNALAKAIARPLYVQSPADLTSFELSKHMSYVGC